ncbi:MAG: hypothetical protein KatS3mg060_3361 [Dehalococcoidia bacterium]|nr:MAG: hypothetical protein KatS3mg060_3361 [Dehalococcoidia bacterium]
MAGARSTFRQVRQVIAPYVRWCGMVLLVWGSISLVHQSYVMIVAQSVRLVAGTPLASEGLLFLPVDQVHAKLALDALAGITPIGLSIGGPLAESINRMFPGADLKEHAGPAGCRCLISLRVGPESPFAGIAFLMSTGLLTVLAVGVVLVLVSRRRAIRFAGAIAILYGLMSVVALPWGLTDLEAVGLAAILTKVIQVDGPLYSTLRGIAAVVLPGWLKLSIVWIGLATGIGLAILLRRGGRPVASPLAVLTEALRLPSPFRRFTPALTIVLVGALFVSGFRGAVSYARVGPTYDGTFGGVDAVVVRTEPSTVRIERVGSGFRYVVNGQVDVVRGMGYNPLGVDPTPEEASRRYRRDFRLMRQAGVNTVAGWNQTLFDERLLDAANVNGLGVILPFELPIDADYRDDAVRAALLQRVKAWVERYQKHPALRMWGLGNEVLHDLTRRDAEQFAAFSQFLVEAADHIHQLDPHYPVVYREAEDVFIPYIEAAMRAKPADRTWFVHGLNFYTPRLEEALTQWENERVPYAALISEFGPHSFHPSARGMGYVRLWRLIRRFPNTALGGVAYVWYTQGPEAIDTVFGFVDDAGQPVDDAYAALRAAYLRTKRVVDEQTQLLVAGATPMPRPATPTSTRPPPPSPDADRLPTGDEAQRIVDAVVQAALARGLSGFEVTLDRRVGDAVVTKVKPNSGAGQWYEAVLRPSPAGWTVIGFGPRPPG